MKKEAQIKVKATFAEKRRWYDAAEASDKTVSEIVRSALERNARRVDRLAGPDKSDVQ